MLDKVLNLHFLDHCNFSCVHCFIDRQGRALSLEQCKKILTLPFIKNNFYRINLAGGEPLLSPYIQELIDFIVEQGYQCSLITNGSRLTTSFIERNRSKLTMIGISVDSLDDETNRRIGRFPLPELTKVCSAIKANGIKLKINICVGKLNMEEDFRKIIELTNPDRLKILQLMESKHINKASELTISNEDFNKVCEKLKDFKPICEESEYMKKAYWIVDSEGYFSKDNLHDKISSINLLTIDNAYNPLEGGCFL